MIYIHVPFCRSFCTYCDFYSEIAGRCRKADEAIRQEKLFEEYSEALAREIAGSGCGSGHVNTLYIGGGTPSVLPLSVFSRLLKALDDAGAGGPYEEFTVEVNPEDIVEKGPEYVDGLLSLGVNRVSMGVQSFDDDILRWMNRRHDAATARKAYAILEEAGVGNISIDLIFGLPQISRSIWTDTLKKALEISGRGVLPRHISSYQLSVEPGSALARLVEEEKWTEASEEECRSQYSQLCSTLTEYGYNHYEISNFAVPGYEARHNSAYWRHVPYMGFGPGAHSFIVGREQMRRWNEPDLEKYLAAASTGDFAPVRGYEILTEDQLVMERVMLGLRTAEGVSEQELRAYCRDLDAAVASGSLTGSACGKFRIPEDRFFISDTIISEL